MTSLLARFMAELRDLAKPVVSSKLVYLSGLSPEEAQGFKGDWPGIDLVRRRRIIGLLVEFAEDNLELDFDEAFRACLADADSEVRVKAIEGLWGCEERSLLDQMTSLLREDSTTSVRVAAAVALRNFALLVEFGKLPPGDTVKVESALLAAFNDGEEQLEVRRRALEAISPLSKPEVKELIRQAYHSDDFELQTSALYAMGQNCDLAWLPILLRELRSPHPEMRFEAARACGALEAEEAVPRLIELTREDDFEVQISAIDALSKIGGNSAKEALRQSLTSPEEPSREAAKKALGEMRFWEDPFSLSAEDYDNG